MSKTKPTSPKKLEKKKFKKLKEKYQEQLDAIFVESDAVESEAGIDGIQMLAAELEAKLVTSPVVDPIPVAAAASALAETLGEERWRLLSEASSEGVLIHENGKVINANLALSHIFGFEKPDDLIGRNLLEFVAPESQAEVIDYIRAGKENPYELVGVRRDGVRIIVESTGRTIKSQNKSYRAATIRDITTWKRAEEELFKFKMGIEQSNDAIFITDTEGRITYVNPGFEKVYGYKKSEAIGQTPRILKSGVIAADQYKHFWQTLLSKQVVAGEIVNKHKDGHLLNIEGANNPIVDSKNQIIGFLAIHHDISDRKQVEGRLLDAIEHLDSGFVMYGPDERLIICNTRYRELYPKSAHLMTPGTPYEDILHESYRQGNYTHTGLSEDEWVANRLALHRATGMRNSYEQQVGQRWIRINDARSSNGGVVSLRTDITASKENEEALRKSQEQYQLAIDGANDGVWDWDLSTNDVYFSPRWKAMVGYEEHELNNGFADFESLLHPDDHDRTLAHVNDYLAGKVASYDIEFRFHHKDGSYRWIRARGKALRNAEGNPYRMAGSHTDITASKENEALNAKRAAELQAVAEISTAASIATNAQDMLQKVVDMTKEGLGFYHVHLYLLDEDNTNLVLTAGAGEIGKQMVNAGRSIPIDHPNSLVARAARTHTGAIANDVTKEKDFLPNPLLPNTLSELATPILVGNNVLGVFDVQADTLDRFSQEDVAIETTLARQIGAALQNVRSLEQSKKTLAELDKLNRRLVREGWQEYQERELSGGHYVYQLPQTVKSGSTEPLHMSAPKKFVAPLAVRGEVIGELEITDTAEDEEAQGIIHAIAERLSAQIENLRLNDQTQLALAETSKRAVEVQAVSEVTTAASTILERDQLLEKAVHLTQRRFNLYHCHVFLYDAATHNLSINACGWREGDIHEGSHGKRIIPLTQERSLVAQAARDRQAVIVNDVTLSSNWLANELLPETKSEVAIPMTVGDTLIGVFDVQSEKANRFSEDDVRTFSTLASAVAVATQNANLFAEQTAIVARLKDVDQLKSSFLANMSHELRTPLNSVIGFTEVLLEGIDGDLTEPMENDLKVIHKNGQHLLKLINDVLDMAKIEAGRMTLTIEEFNLQEVIEEVTQITRPLADAKSIELRLDMNPNVDLTLEADRIRMRQVMINLVNNSIKFTEIGYVSIDAIRMDDLIKVTVKDTGVGIPHDHLDKIFQEFTQVDTSTTRKAGGTGLGLPISRHLVDLHGGRLWAESSGITGEGSVFHIELPLIAKRTVE